MSQVRRQSAVLPRPNWGWQDAAACRGEDLLLFFGPDGERQPEREIRERKAKEVCAACPVRLECLNYAVSRPEKYGTWGGLNEDERSAERRRRMSARTLPETAGGKAGQPRPPSLATSPPRPEFFTSAGRARRRR
jgi:WhiB family transcriptional regulator, redox-sensing transcriptional regulator